MIEILIHKVGPKYEVRSGTTPIGSWSDIRKAKAARGALDNGLRCGLTPAAAIMFAMGAARDEAIVASYSDSEDETVVQSDGATPDAPQASAPNTPNVSETKHE